MAPIILVRSLALCMSLAFAAQASGAWDALIGCAGECASDDEDGGCPPSCTACVCAAPRVPTTRKLELGPPAPLLLTLTAALWPDHRSLSGPGPSEVWHVPRRARV